LVINSYFNTSAKARCTCGDKGKEEKRSCVMADMVVEVVRD
jgi:hypothetical protein